MRKPNIRLSTALLAILNGGLLALLLVIERWGEARVQQPNHLADRHLAQPDLSPLDQPAAPRTDLDVVRDNAVFYEHRTFYQPPPPGERVAVPEYDFAGSIGLPQGKRLAFVKKRSDKSSRTLHVGDDLDGWRVEVIESARVVIVRDKQQIELTTGNGSDASGLVRGTVTPYVAQSGLRIVGAAAAMRAPQAARREARTYQPPPKN